MPQDKSQEESGDQEQETSEAAGKTAKPDQTNDQAADGTEIAEQAAGPQAQAGARPTPRARGGQSREAGSGRPASTSRVLDRLGDDRDTAEKLRALQARQRRLPLDIDAAQQGGEARTRTKQTRDELVERLLDPVLTLQETAILLDVCPTTVRRYTNRGVLNCFRTPGNQRRFRLSDVISFMERRDS